MLKYGNVMLSSSYVPRYIPMNSAVVCAWKIFNQLRLNFLRRELHTNPPFTDPGADYFGHLYVPIRLINAKRWCFLFNCFTTCVVNMWSCLWTQVMGVEFLSNGSGAARRSSGTPKKTWIVNQTNFVGFDAEEVQWKMDTIKITEENVNKWH